MTAEWRETFRLWSRTEQHTRALHKARAIIERALESAQKPYIAYSGGKDSTVMAHLVLQYAPDTMVLHWDYGRAFVPEPIQREILRNARVIGVRNLRIETSPLYAKLGRRAQNVLGKHMIGKLLPQLAAEGYDLAFVGLRKQESPKRARRLRANKPLSTIPECYPLADWDWRDVWAYIVAHKLPYLSLYDQRAELVGYNLVRFTTLFDPEFEHLGAPTIDNYLHWRHRNETRS
jgi:3'-phosphoadenosine 5'-phosphosulfate sulfotransferase (PAPS reductase)/FAD synthetase